MSTDDTPGTAVENRQYVDIKVGRNDKCPCHSGKKYKHCCNIRLKSKYVRVRVK